MTPQEIEREQRKALDRLGTDVVKARLRNVGAAAGAQFPLGVPGTASPPCGYVEEWLAEKEHDRAKLETQRFRVLKWIATASVVVSALGILASIILSK